MAGVDPISLTKKDKDELIEMINAQKTEIDQLKKDKTRGKTGSDETVDGTSSIGNAFDPLKLANVSGLLESMKESILGVANIKDFSTFKELDELSNTIQQNFGLAKGRVSEFKTAIADAAPELAKMGYTQQESADLIADSMDGLKSSALLSTQTLIEMGAVSKVTGLDVNELAEGFRSVGISMQKVGEEMKGVTDYARSVGMSVKTISTGVEQNIEKINLYNFDNGVQGLAKMAATSERFGLSMTNTFRIAEELFSPENAINMAAGLQRLGVASSALLDPLRAMDLAQNDPEALQKEIVNLSKEFTTFNEKTGKMEILPGAQRRLREVAKELNIDASEFAKMSIQAGDFDRKLKQIRMPSLAEGDDATKELIASMAQLDSSGVATIQVKDMETGNLIEKNVEELTPEDIENLKKANDESSMKIEQIAVKQLDETKQTNSILTSSEYAGKFARATSPTMEKLTNFVSNSYKDVASKFRDEIGTTQGLRNKFERVAGPTEDLFVAMAERKEENVIKAMAEFTKGASDIKDSFLSASESFVANVINSRKEDLKKTYSSDYKPVNETKTFNVNWNITGDPNVTKNINQETFDKMLNTSTTDPNINVMVSSNLDGGSAPSAATGSKNK
jgi:hypothetical protein